VAKLLKNGKTAATRAHKPTCVNWGHLRSIIVAKHPSGLSFITGNSFVARPRPAAVTEVEFSAKTAEEGATSKLIAIHLNAKVSSHQRPTLKRLERFERLERLEPVDS